MSFNIESAKWLLSVYSNELNREDKIRAALESKANTQMKITGIILGLYGTMSTIFLVSVEILMVSKNILLINAYIINRYFLWCFNLEKV